MGLQPRGVSAVRASALKRSPLSQRRAACSLPPGLARPLAKQRRLFDTHKVRNPVGFPRSATISGKRLLPPARRWRDLRPEEAAKNMPALEGLIVIEFAAPILEPANRGG